VTETFEATAKKIDPKRKEHEFEILGYDFMIDADLKVYLIEVNTNPCLETGCPLLARILTNLIDSAFRLTVDPLFPGKKTGDRPLHEIKFTMIYKE